MSNALCNCCIILRVNYQLRFSFITAGSFILFRIYIGRHFVYLVFVYIMSPCIINK